MPTKLAKEDFVAGTNLHKNSINKHFMKYFLCPPAWESFSSKHFLK